jgi:hypothetical protein
MKTKARIEVFQCYIRDEDGIPGDWSLSFDPPKTWYQTYRNGGKDQWWSVNAIIELDLNDPQKSIDRIKKLSVLK